jgi:hypothetical protein
VCLLSIRVRAPQKGDRRGRFSSESACGPLLKSLNQQMLLDDVTRAMASRLVSRDHEMAAIRRSSVNFVSGKAEEPSSGWTQILGTGSNLINAMTLLSGVNGLTSVGAVQLGMGLGSTLERYFPDCLCSGGKPDTTYPNRT